jgi:hypothetical protein
MLQLAMALFAAIQAPVSSCTVSTDAAFAFTKEHAAQVGGGAMYAAARERRYLDALRGPGGEPIEYKRRGSLLLDREGHTILDAYEVTYRGLAQPATLYLDAYHFDDALAAPAGFICAVPFALQPPGPDPFLAMDALRAVAFEQGAAKDFAPIPLDANGTTTHGVLLDGFRVMALAARSASAAGTRTDPANPPRELLRTRMIVVVYPVRCGEAADPVAPQAIDLVADQGVPPKRDGDPVTGEALARLLPGVQLPPRAMAVVYPLDRPRPTDTLRIGYGEPCGEVVLPFKYTNGRPVSVPPATLPAGVPPTDRPVRVQAVLDLDGAVRQPVYAGGPAQLADAAIAAVRQWTAEPVRLNGAPVPAAVVLSVRFR